MKKNNGFTLIELLAVVVILAVIALISTPIILNIVENAQEGAFKNTAYGLVQASKFSYTNEIIQSSDVRGLTFSYIDGNEISNPIGKTLDYKGTRPKSGSVLINSEGQVSLAIYNGKVCAEKTYGEPQVTITDKTETECLATLGAETSGVNEPELSSDMIPVKWDGLTWVKADVNNTPGAVQWYNYSEKQWANVALVSAASRTGYKTAAIGTEVKEADVMAYLVWIPRYKYKLFNVGAGVVAKTTIDIAFDNKTTAKSVGFANGEYLTHPAFTFGTTELNGIWVGKFETTGSAATPTIKPNVAALRSQLAHDQFTTAQKFNTTTTYGLSMANDAHMMKSTEWGAVAYLSNSVYGKNSEVWINPNNAYITGCAGTDASVASTAECYAYTRTNGKQASTTGNIYGVYDMSGGVYERVMAAPYIDAAKTSLYIPTTSGFTTSSTITVAFLNDAANAKYLDKYNYAATYTDYSRRILGDATSETRAWNSDYARLLYMSSGASWNVRGYAYSNTTSAGIFAHSYTTGASSSSIGFRTVIISQ